MNWIKQIEKGITVSGVSYVNRSKDQVDAKY